MAAHRTGVLAGTTAAILGLSISLGCDTSPPGAGITNGPPPAAPEQPAVRTDLPVPAPANPPIAVDDQAQGGPTNQGSNDKGNPALKKPEESASGKPDVRATPPKIEDGSPSGASGATKSGGDVKVGTPQSPQL